MPARLPSSLTFSGVAKKKGSLSASLSNSGGREISYETLTSAVKLS